MQVLALDRVLARYGPETACVGPCLARYGPETASIREHLKQVVGERLGKLDPSDRSEPVARDATSVAMGSRAESLADDIRLLDPKDELQRSLQSRGVDFAESILQAPWLVAAGSRASVPTPFLVVLLFWLTLIFTCYGMLAPRKGTVIAVSVRLLAVDWRGPVRDHRVGRAVRRLDSGLTRSTSSRPWPGQPLSERAAARPSRRLKEPSVQPVPPSRPQRPVEAPPRLRGPDRRRDRGGHVGGVPHRAPEPDGQRGAAPRHAPALQGHDHQEHADRDAERGARDLRFRGHRQDGRRDAGRVSRTRRRRGHARDDRRRPTIPSRGVLACPRQASVGCAGRGLVAAHEPGRVVPALPLPREGSAALRPVAPPRVQHRHEYLWHRAEGGAAEAGAVLGTVRVPQRHPRRPRDPGGLLQLRGLHDCRHQPRQGALRDEQRRGARTRPQPVESDRRLPRGRFRPVPAEARRPDGLHRLARVRRPPHGRRHAAAVPDRADRGRAVRRAPVGSRGARQDRRGVPARARHDDADRLTVPDRGSRRRSSRRCAGPRSPRGPRTR